MSKKNTFSLRKQNLNKEKLPIRAERVNYNLTEREGDRYIETENDHRQR